MLLRLLRTSTLAGPDCSVSLSQMLCLSVCLSFQSKFTENLFFYHVSMVKVNPHAFFS